MRVGDVVDARFEIEARVGSGGMGEVFRALDRSTSSHVAIKFVRDEHGNADERFAREASVLAALDHPAIVRHVAHGKTAAGGMYLAMEWLEGEDVAARLEHERFTPGDTWLLARRVAEALAVAHAHGVVHRDIKPGNVFLPGNDVRHAKLLDFGIARGIGPMQPITRTGVMIGTPRYIAPEQVRGERMVGPAADVFALGCLVYECLTGSPAFAGENVMAVLARILLQDPPRLADACPGVAPALDALVNSMLAREPRDRPADGAAVLRVLDTLGDLADLRFAPRVPDAPPPAALTAGELRLTSVVLIAPEPGASSGTGTSPESAARAVPIADASTVEVSGVGDVLASVRAVVEQFGGRLEHLARGAIVVSMSPIGVATEQSSRGARCALALRRVVPDRVIALATGRAQWLGGAPLGEVIDRAARLLVGTVSGDDGSQAASDVRPVRIDALTAGLLGPQFDVRAAGEAMLLQGERGEFHAVRTLLGRSTPYVGRDREVASVLSYFDECVEESVSRAVLVTAPAGVGKSRLAHEFLQRIRARGGVDAQVWTARADPLRMGTPFGLLAQLLRDAAGIEGGAAADGGVARFRARIGAPLPEVARENLVEFLGEIAGVAAEGAGSVQFQAARRDARLMGDHMLRAWEQWITAVSAVRPVVLVLEDLHWGDAPTARYLDAALRAARDRPLMLLALARPEVHEVFPNLWRDRGVQEIRLGELTPRAAAKLVRAVLGNGVGEDTVEQIVALAAGNAFYLEEVIRASAEGSSRAMPGTAVAMVQSRVESLEPAQRRVLRAASVIGETFWRAGVAALTGGDAGLDTVLAALVEREVVAPRERTRLPGEVEYAFRHALMREAAYAMLTDHDRALGHRLAGEWLESAGEPDALVLAEHFERGGAGERAAHWVVRAAEQAYRKNDFVAVPPLFERALALGLAAADRGDARVTVARAMACTGRWAEARDAYLEALLTLPEDRHTELRLEAGMLEFWRQDAAAIRMHATAALSLARARGMRDAEIDALAVLGIALATQGHQREGVAAIREAMALGPTRFSEPLAMGGQLLYHAALLDESLATSRRAADYARSVGDVRGEALATANEGMSLSARGRYADAERAFAWAIEISQRYGLGPVLARATSMSANPRFDLFDFEAVERIATRAREFAAASQFEFAEISSGIDLIRVHTRKGDFGRAEALIESVESACARTSAHQFLWVSRLKVSLAELSLAQGRWEDALSTARDAEEASHRIGRAKYTVAAICVRASALRALGRIDDARRSLRDAVAIARPIGDPAMFVRAAAPLIELEDDATMRAEALAMVDVVVAGAPDMDATRTYLAAEPIRRLTGRAPPD